MWCPMTITCLNLLSLGTKYLEDIFEIFYNLNFYESTTGGDIYFSDLCGLTVSSTDASWGGSGYDFQ